MSSQGKCKSMFALVKWLSGDDKDKYTAGIPTEWIKKFDLKMFQANLYSKKEIFVCEWRDKKTKPPGGWPLWDVMVAAVAEKVSVLEKKLRDMAVPVSPNRKIRAPKAIIKSKGEEDQKKEKASSSAQPVGSIRRSPRKQPTPQKNSVPLGSHKKSSKRLLLDKDDLLSTKRTKTDKGKDESASLERLESGLMPLPGEDITLLWKQILDGQQEILKEIRSVKSSLDAKVFQQQSTITSTAPSAGCSGYPQSFHPSSVPKQDLLSACAAKSKMIKIGSSDNLIEVKREAWDSARAAATPSAMVAALLMGAFEVEDLLASNYKGGAGKNHKDPSASKLKALDPKKLAAIKAVVVEKFPAFTPSQFGSAVNVKTTNLRLKFRSQSLSSTQAAEKKKPSAHPVSKPELNTSNHAKGEEEKLSDDENHSVSEVENCEEENHEDERNDIEKGSDSDDNELEKSPTILSSGEETE